jgi:tyrosine-protein kinase Etk/Wzc
MEVMPQETYDRSSEPAQGQPSSGKEAASLDLVALWKVFRAGKRKILLASLVGFVLFAVVAFLSHNVYTATASFVVPTSSNSVGSSIASQLSGVAVGGFSSALRNPSDQQLGILGSRSIAMDMVSRFNLQTVYGAKKESQAIAVLKGASVFEAGAKDGIITISVTDPDPKRAQDMANAYLDELRLANGRLALTEASQRRLFFEQQMAQEKEALDNAEADLQKTQEQTGLIAPPPATSLTTQQMADTRAEIESREAQLAGMLQGSTEQDPAVIRLRSEIASLEGQLSQMMTGGGNGPAAAKFPKLQMDYMRKQREVSYHETIFDILSKQYEAARLDESHDAPTLQVLDSAVLPDTKSGPHRTLMALIGLLLGAVLSSLWVLSRPLIAQVARVLAPYRA